MFVSEAGKNPMRPNFTLPELQTRLDRLDQEAMLGISDPDVEWLFGKKNDVAAARLLHFAKGHDCIDSRGWGTDRRPGRKQGEMSP